MPSPLRRPDALAPVSEKPIARSSTHEVDSLVQPHAEWADRYLGNRDGFLDPSELEAFERDYSADAAMLERVLEPLRRHLEKAAQALAPRTPEPDPQAPAPAATLTVAEVLRGAHRRLDLSRVAAPGSTAATAATFADQAWGNADGALDSSEVEELESSGSFPEVIAQLRAILAERGEQTRDPSAPPPEGAPAMAAAISGLPQSLRAWAEYQDRMGNLDGMVDSREIKEHADALRRHSAGPLPESSLFVLRQLYRFTNAGSAVPGTRMGADGSGLTEGWPPPSSRLVVPAAQVDARRLALARRVVVPAGTARDEDVEVVVREVARLPLPILQVLLARRIPVRVARENVVDAEPELRREHPRGWGAGASFSEVPGIYHPPSRSVIVSTEAKEGGGRQMSDDHGSLDVLVHEIGHALDGLDAFDFRGFGGTSGSRDFRQAYRADLPNLRRLDRKYLTQEDGGEEEAFAEGFAAYLSGNQFMPVNTPHLRAYFDRYFEAVERHAEGDRPR